MSEEREFAKHVDKIILNASREELLEIQKLDSDTQLDGNSFYEIYSTKRKTNCKQVYIRIRDTEN